MKKKPNIKVLSNPQAVFNAAAKDFTRRAMDAVDKKGVFTVALSGGTTPQFFFDALVSNKTCREKTPWRHIKFFFSDERYVPSDDIQNNYHTAYVHLFSKISVPAENIYAIPTQCSDPHQAAKRYEETLRKVLLVTDHAFPVFDLVYLGLGENAHTASLMPFDAIVTSHTKQLAAALWASTMHRITLTATAINHATCIIFLVTGQNKASAVWNVLEGSCEPSRYPAQCIHSIHGKTIWYLDEAAAKKLSAPFFENNKG